MRLLALLLVLMAPVVAAAAQPAPSDAATLDALERALVQPISWQVLAGALGALGLWVVRYRRQIAAIDTKTEYIALASAVGTASVAALLAGSAWQVVLVGAIGAFMAFVHLNSGPAGGSTARDEAR